jgi:hypothetical protein
MTSYLCRNMHIRAHQCGRAHLPYGAWRQRDGRAGIARGAHGSNQIVCSTSW